MHGDEPTNDDVMMDGARCQFYTNIKLRVDVDENGYVLDDTAGGPLTHSLLLHVGFVSSHAFIHMIYVYVLH